jgi:AcrR family transcriptional regulator
MSAVADTTEKILSAAGRLFAERGYAATTTRAIAGAADVNEVTIFRHFENKAGVLKALGERFAEQSAARSMQELPDAANVRETLLALARAEIASAAENGGVALRLAFDARSVPEVAALIGQGPKGNLEELAAYFEDRQAAGQVRADLDSKVMAEAFASITSSFVMYRMVMGVLDPEDAAKGTTVEQLVDLFLDGAAPREQHARR